VSFRVFYDPCFSLVLFSFAFLFGLNIINVLFLGGDYAERTFHKANTKEENTAAHEEGDRLQAMYRTNVPASSYRGVCFNARNGKYGAQVTIRGVTVFIGWYCDELNAMRVFDYVASYMPCRMLNERKL
jgi:hypothetical protein